MYETFLARKINELKKSGQYREFFSIHFISKLGTSIVSGYSSFASASRTRSLGLIFNRKDGGRVYAEIIYDTPKWDEDTLLIWDDQKTIVHKRFHSFPDPALATLKKLLFFIEEFFEFILYDKSEVKFADFQDGIELHKILKVLQQASGSFPTLSYGARDLRKLHDKSDLERLG